MPPQVCDDAELPERARAGCPGRTRASWSGCTGEDGRFVPGRASKWKAGEELMARMEAVEVAGGWGGDVASEVAGVEAVEEKEEEESILYGNNRLHLHLDQPVTDQDDPSKASTTGQIHAYNPRPETIDLVPEASSTTSASGSPSPGPDLRATARAITGWRREKRRSWGADLPSPTIGRQSTNTWGRGSNGASPPILRRPAAIYGHA